jgi:hypothetical protein
MSRMFFWTGIGAVAGFVVFTVLFAIVGRKEPEGIVFSIMAAMPIACIGSVFGAVSVVRQELNTMRREMMRLQRIEPQIAIQDTPSTQFKPE